MKKLILSISVCLLISMATFSQTEKGSFLIGAGTNLVFSVTESGSESDVFGYQKFSDNSVKNVNLSGGYFVTDNFLIGTSLHLFFFKNEYVGIGENNEKEVIISPFVRRYFGEETMRYFLNAGIGFGKNKGDYFGTDVNDKSFSYELGGGVSVFLRENISLDLGLRYVYSSRKSKEDNSKSITKGFRSSVGFSFYL